jgi:hypothetical protein
MAATSKTNATTMGKITGSVISLQPNGSNVRAWESDLLALCRASDASTLLLKDYNMHVSAQQTLSLDLSRRVEKNIRARRAEFVDNSRYVRAQEALTKSVQVKEEKDALSEQPPLDGSAQSGSTRQGSRYAVGDAADDSDDVQDVTDSKHKEASVERERKARERALVMSQRLATRQLLTERRGANLAVFFLDPVSALTLDDPCDREMVCHEHTLYGETMRYAIESTDDMRTRMRIDAAIVSSLKLIPSHVTAGVVPGNVSDRFERVVVFFDDVTRETIVEQVDASLSSLLKKEKECFSAFTSRFKNIEYSRAL